MSNILDLVLMLMNVQQMIPNLQQPTPQLTSNIVPDPYANLIGMPNVQVIRGTARPREGHSPATTTATTPTEPPIDFSNTIFQEIKMNKCCPLNYHYAEDKFGRMKCKQTDSEFARIISKSKIFKTVKQYACEASMGHYIDDFSQLDLNGDGFVKYKNEIYEKFCIDYDVQRGKFIIMKCKGSGRKLNEELSESQRDSRVLEILKKRADKLSDMKAPVRKPQLKTRATRPTKVTTTTSTNIEEYSYEEVDKSEEQLPDIKSQSETRNKEVIAAKSAEYEYEYDEGEE